MSYPFIIVSRAPAERTLDDPDVMKFVKIALTGEFTVPDRQDTWETQFAADYRRCIELHPHMTLVLGDEERLQAIKAEVLEIHERRIARAHLKFAS